MIDDLGTPEIANAPIPADRDIPSVSSIPKSKYVLMAAFLSLAAFAMGFVIIDGMEKNTTPSLIEPEEMTFKSPGTTSTPYIEPEPLAELEPNTIQESPKIDTQNQQVSDAERLMQAEALKIAKEQQKRHEERLRSPQLIIDKSVNSHNVSSASRNLTTSSDAKQLTSDIPGDQQNVFSSNIQNVENSRAIQIMNLSSLIPQGTLIPGILETAIQSDLPGMVRSIVSENVYGHDGRLILIPRGTRLIGRYRSGLVRGQTRIFVIWDRVLRQDGVSVNLGSIGTDDLGRSGLSGDLDTHFLERFGSSIMLSMIDAGLQLGSRSLDNQNSATVALESGNDFSKSAEIALENSVSIAPTIRVDQGGKIKVFVAKDLDFSEVVENLQER